MFPKRMHHFSPWLLVAINEGNREGNGKIRLIRCPLPGHETIYASSPVNGDIVSTKTAQYPQKKNPNAIGSILLARRRYVFQLSNAANRRERRATLKQTLTLNELLALWPFIAHTGAL